MKLSPPSTVLLVGGASGCGKSSITYPLGAHLEIAVLEVDDLGVAIRAVTDTHTFPELHYWQQHPDEVGGWDIEQVVEHQRLVAAALWPAIRAVIDNHLDTDIAVIIDVDYLLSSLDTALVGDRVRSLWINEPSVDQIEANYRRREPAAGHSESVPR